VQMKLDPRGEDTDRQEDVAAVLLETHVPGYGPSLLLGAGRDTLIYLRYTSAAATRTWFCQAIHN
jgi:hypothetical protein